VNPAWSWAFSSTVRARGRPSAVMVDSTIAVGSVTLDASASSIHRANCVIGSSAI